MNLCLAYLQAFLAGQVSSGAIYIWGRKGTGRSALLRGLCAQIPNTHTCYLEGSKSAGLLVGVEQWFARAELICIDDAELLTPDWLTVMASWIERAENQGLRLVIVGDHPPRAHEEGELRSLLSSLPSWQLHRLSEVQRRLMVAQWAKKEQVALSEAMLGSFLQRAPVSLSAMWQMWTKLLASASAGGITVKLIEEMAERRYQNGQ